MKNLFAGFALSLFVLFAGCNNEPTPESNGSENVEYFQSPELAEGSLPSGFILVGHIYSVGPQFDSATCTAYGECDCCMSDYAFITDSTFVAVDYCLESNGYYTGTYRIEGNRIVFKLSDKYVSKNFPELGTEADSLPPFTLNSEMVERRQFTWRCVKCRASLCFKNDIDEYAAVETTTVVQFINALKADSIWQLLEAEN